MNILHISDMHIGKNIQKKENLAQAIDDAIEEHKDCYPDVLIITGDFTNTANPIEFKNAKTIIESFDKFDSLRNIKHKIVVPGNHDFLWESENEKLEKDQNKVNYENFYNNFKSSKVKNQTLQKSLDKYLINHQFLNLGDNALLIIGMNSMQIDSKERAGQGLFTYEQLKTVKKLIKEYKAQCDKIEIIVAFHHHIVPTSSVERDTLANRNKFSLTLDARRLIDFCLENDISFAINGHQHQPSITTWKDDMKYPHKELHIISAGSISAEISKLGDISKNSFMIYKIDGNVFEVKHFLTTNSDIDKFEMDTNLSCKFNILKNTSFKNSACDYSLNNFIPKEVVFLNHQQTDDVSNLFYLFLNVIDCGEASAQVDSFVKKYNLINESKITLCGIHHLYGKFDILIKYRDNTNGELFKKSLLEHLKEKKITQRNFKSYFMNVSSENLFSSNSLIPFMNNKEAYLNSTWNMATILVETGSKLNPTEFLQALKSDIEIFNTKYNTKIEDIIKGYVIGQDQWILFELFISCYQFPMLTKFTNLIEEIIKKDGVDKSTHIIYHYDEREI